jgi:hypothetical protein
VVLAGVSPRAAAAPSPRGAGAVDCFDGDFFGAAAFLVVFAAVSAGWLDVAFLAGNAFDAADAVLVAVVLAAVVLVAVVLVAVVLVAVVLAAVVLVAVVLVAALDGAAFAGTAFADAAFAGAAFDGATLAGAAFADAFDGAAFADADFAFDGLAFDGAGAAFAAVLIDAAFLAGAGVGACLVAGLADPPFAAVTALTAGSFAFAPVTGFPPAADFTRSPTVARPLRPALLVAPAIGPVPARLAMAPPDAKWARDAAPRTPEGGKNTECTRVRQTCHTLYYRFGP